MGDLCSKKRSDNETDNGDEKERTRSEILKIIEQKYMKQTHDTKTSIK